MIGVQSVLDQDHVTNPRLPIWTRVWIAAQMQADDQGCSWWGPGELRWTIDPTGLTTPNSISRGITQCVMRGLLDARSNARGLRLR